jgi:hypothetical protein
MFKKFFKREPDPIVVLAELLNRKNNREDLLGVSPVGMPQPNDILRDSARILQYSLSDDYKTFANEAWARVITELDKIIDPRTSVDQIQNARGALRATLDLLRLSYQARFTKEKLESERSVQDASLTR